MRDETDHGTSGETASEMSVAQAAEGRWQHALVRLARRLPGASWATAPYRRLLDTVNIVEQRVAIAEARLQALREQEIRALAALNASEQARAAHVEVMLQQIKISLSALAYRLDQHAEEIASRLAQIEATAATQSESTASMHAEILSMLQRTNGDRGPTSAMVGYSSPPSGETR